MSVIACRDKAKPSRRKEADDGSRKEKKPRPSAKLEPSRNEAASAPPVQYGEGGGGIWRYGCMPPRPSAKLEPSRNEAASAPRVIACRDKAKPSRRKEADDGNRKEKETGKDKRADKADGGKEKKAKASKSSTDDDGRKRRRRRRASGIHERHS